MLGVLATLKLLNDIAERQSKALFLAESVRCFPRQARLVGRILTGGIFLLRLNGLAFPAPRHGLIIVFIDIFLGREGKPCKEFSRPQSSRSGQMLLRKAKPEED